MVNKIYNLKKGKIEVYSYNINSDKFRAFSMQELYKIPEDERLLRKDSPTTWFSPKNGIVFSCGAFVLRKVPKEGRLTLDPMEENFIKGDFIIDPIKEVEREDNDNILTYLCPNRDCYDIKIQITEDMKLALLLAREDFSSDDLQKSDLSKFRELFDISDKPLFNIDLVELKKMYLATLIEGSINNQINYLNKSSKVYSKLKK